MTDLENIKCSLGWLSHLSSRKWFGAAAAYYAMIFVLSQIPGRTLNRLPFSFWDKGAHFSVYAGLGFLLYFGFCRRHTESVNPLKSLVLTIVLVGILGGLDEVHQMFVPGRFAALDDVAADLLGGSFGGLFALLVRRRQAALQKTVSK